MFKASYIAIAIGTTPISMLWRKFTDRAEAMVSMRSPWRCARNDGVIIGASSLEHLRHNLTAVTEGPLPTDVLTAIDDAALKAQPKWPPYFYGV
jgi:aryl-alcohol dehydrogenase-like predicted oxidoreductase